MNGGIDKDDDDFPREVGCEESKERKIKNQKFCEDGIKVTEELFKALNAPKRFRLKIIKIIFPEIVGVAKSLKDFYWKEK